MITKELIDYIKKELERGEQKDAIKARLLQNGWSGGDVEEALRVVEKNEVISAENIPASVFVNNDNIATQGHTEFNPMITWKKWILLTPIVIISSFFLLTNFIPFGYHTPLYIKLLPTLIALGIFIFSLYKTGRKIASNRCNHWWLIKFNIIFTPLVYILVILIELILLIPPSISCRGEEFCGIGQFMIIYNTASKGIWIIPLLVLLFSAIPSLFFYKFYQNLKKFYISAIIFFSFLFLTAFFYHFLVIIYSDILHSDILNFNKSAKVEVQTEEKVLINTINKDLTVMHLTSSPDGEKVIYGVYYNINKDNEKQSIFINNEEGKRYDYIRAGKDFPYGINIFSPNGKEFAYIAFEGGKPHYGEDEDKIKTILVINGEEKEKKSGKYNICCPIFSPDSKKLAYIMDNSIFINNKKVIELDINDKWQDVYASNISSNKRWDYIYNLNFSPDSQFINYVGQEARQSNDKFFIVNDLNGRIISEYGPLPKSVGVYPYDTNPVFSPDGKKLAYIKEDKKTEKMFVVMYDREGEKYDSISNLIWSPDSKILAYLATEVALERTPLGDSKEFVVVNGKKGKKYDHVNILRFTPDSKSIVYSATFDIQAGDNGIFGKRALVVGEEIVDIFTESDKERVKNTFLSPDGKTIVYKISSKEKAKFIINNNEGEYYNNTPTDPQLKPIFSPDGMFVAYIAHRITASGLRTVLVINNEEVENYKGVISNPVFLDNQTIRYYTYEGGNIYRITKTLQ